MNSSFPDLLMQRVVHMLAEQPQMLVGTIRQRVLQRGELAESYHQHFILIHFYGFGSWPACSF